MKFVLLAAAAALMMNAQAPVAAKPESVPTVLNQKSTERALTKDELLEFRSTMAEIKNLRVQYKIDEFQEKVQPKVAEQQEAFVKVCRSVGVPEEKIQPANGQSECGMNTGLDNDGNPLKGPDGKPIAPKVWWAKPAPADKK